MTAPQDLINSLVDDVCPRVGCAARVYPPHLHGRDVGNSTYTKWGCRCEGCTRAHRESASAWYARKCLADRERARAVAEQATIRAVYQRFRSVKAVMDCLDVSYERVQSALQAVAA
jgi:hypothetical protein